MEFGFVHDPSSAFYDRSEIFAVDSGILWGEGGEGKGGGLAWVDTRCGHENAVSGKPFGVTKDKRCEKGALSVESAGRA